MPLKLVKSHPLNRRVIRHLASHCRSDVPAIAAPDSHSDPYWKLGARPDEVMIVWDHLNAALPADCRAIVYGIPALVHPTTGVVLALAYGTTTAIRVPRHLVEAALEAGCRLVERWSNGGSMDIEREFGPGWVFGGGSRGSEWLLPMYEELDAST